MLKFPIDHNEWMQMDVTGGSTVQPDKKIMAAHFQEYLYPRTETLIFYAINSS